MPSFAFRVAWCAAAASLGAIAGCSLDMNGTGAALASITDGPDASSTGTGEEGDASGKNEASVATNGSDGNAPDATLPDGALMDGTIPDASLRETSAPDGTPPDAVGGGEDAPTCTTASGGGCIVVPTGWSIVAFAEAQTQPCPSAFNAGSSDVVEAPNAANACSCGACTVTTQPSCDQGTIGVTYGTSSAGFGGGFGGNGGNTGAATCTTAGASLSAASGDACTTIPGAGGQGPSTFNAVAYTPPAPTGGSCTSPGVANPTQITYGAEERVCTAGASVTQACSGGAPCGANVDSGYMLCIMMPGAPVACPAGSPLSTPHWIGGPANLACSDCGCAMSASACGGTLTTFRDANCTTIDATSTVDGTCQSAVTPTEAVTYRYMANAVNASCTATSTSMATNVALTSPATICCTQ